MFLFKYKSHEKTHTPHTHTHRDKAGSTIGHFHVGVADTGTLLLVMVASCALGGSEVFAFLPLSLTLLFNCLQGGQQAGCRD